MICNMVWPFEDSANDVSGNDRHGSANGPIQIEGRLGNAYQFDGIDDFIQIPSLPASSEFSIGAWVYITSINDVQANISKRCPGR